VVEQGFEVIKEALTPTSVPNETSRSISNVE